VDLDEEAVLAGDPVALADLIHPTGQLGDPGQLARGGPDPDERGDRQAERGRVDLQAVAGDDAGPLQALDPLGNRRGGHPDSPGEGGHADPRAGLQLPEQRRVGLIRRYESERR
jgi:hypothetical protein